MLVRMGIPVTTAALSWIANLKFLSAFRSLTWNDCEAPNVWEPRKGELPLKSFLDVSGEAGTAGDRFVGEEDEDSDCS